MSEGRSSLIIGFFSTNNNQYKISSTQKIISPFLMSLMVLVICFTFFWWSIDSILYIYKIQYSLSGSMMCIVSSYFFNVGLKPSSQTSSEYVYQFCRDSMTVRIYAIVFSGRLSIRCLSRALHLCGSLLTISHARCSQRKNTSTYGCLSSRSLWVTWQQKRCSGFIVSPVSSSSYLIAHSRTVSPCSRCHDGSPYRHHI